MSDSEPVTPGDELDENFYAIDDTPSDGQLQAYIDEPLSPTGDDNPNFRYTVLSADEYVTLMLKYVDEVADVLQLSRATVKLLLNHFKWNKQRLLEQFYEMDPDKFFQQAKTINPFEQTPAAQSATGTCLICCSDEDKDMFSLECRHTFCNDCWKSYLLSQIVGQGLAQTIVCPDAQCEILVGDDTIQRFLADDPFVQHVYSKLIMNSYIENNPRARWCPGKNCEHIVHATSLTSAYNYAQLITCSHCQTSFCFQCAQPWHDPIKCVLLRHWNQQLLDDSKSVVWIRAHTKPCPKCHVNIEKNEGCNHMTCKNCSYEFCWLCFGKWSGHSQCNRYDEHVQADELRAARATALARYMHYHDRFRSHEHSLDLESKRFRKVSRKVARDEQRLSNNDVLLVNRAFDVLLTCRQMLTYTYPFAYYLVKNNQSEVFEQNQADLERACEELSELLGKDFFKDTVLDEIRRRLSDKVKYCEARKAVLLKHVKEGYANDYWEYQEEIAKTMHVK